MSILRVTFLGTSAAAPTIHRGLSATSVRVHQDHLLVDCGEGTQRQMLRFGTGFRTDIVLFTHFHADHYLGIIGFLRTLAMMGHTAPMQLCGPGPQLHTLLKRLVHLGFRDMPFPLEYVELEGGDVIERPGYRIRAVRADHRMPTLAYAIEEPPRPGRFDVSRARALGVPEGPLFGRLQQGEAVTVEGRTVRPQDVLGPSRPGRKLVLSGDTRPCDRIVDASQDADALVHEATFSREEQERALETNHSTAREAAEVAHRAGVHHLVLSHLSSRFDRIPYVLAEEAAEVYRGPITVADDGLEIEVPFRDA